MLYLDNYSSVTIRRPFKHNSRRKVYNHSVQVKRAGTGDGVALSGNGHHLSATDVDYVLEACNTMSPPVTHQ